MERPEISAAFCLDPLGQLAVRLSDRVRIDAAGKLRWYGGTWHYVEGMIGPNPATDSMLPPHALLWSIPTPSITPQPQPLMDDFNHHDFASAVDAACPGRDTLPPAPSRWKARIWALLLLAFLAALLLMPAAWVVAVVPALK